jgi:hypothetical protein
MFPQKVKDRSLYASQGSPISAGSSLRNDSANQLVEGIHHRLGAIVSALTSASQSLEKLGSSQGELKQEHLASEIGAEVRRALKPLMDPLLESIRDLSHSIDTHRQPAQVSHAETDKMIDQLMSRLTNDPIAIETKADFRPGQTGSGWRIPGFKRRAPNKAEGK